jgi:dTDP-4-dehydrorhamnose 3,5-epimerase
MIFRETSIPGAYVIEPQRIEDHRGFFARIWCQRELVQQGLKADLSQTNVCFSHQRGTLRGVHFQHPPHAEVKIVRCTRGIVFDVIVDLRPDSPTWKRWFGIELSEDNRRTLYVPEGCAQGSITLADDTEIYYHASQPYHPESATGVRYDDPEFSIAWPIAVEVISSQDRAWPDYARGASVSVSSKGRQAVDPI